MRSQALKQLTILLIAWSTLPAAGQEHRTIGMRTCTDCKLRIDRITTLGEANGPGGVGPVFTLARLSTGEYAVSYDGATDEVLVFDATGIFRRQVGRRGDGPGEFHSIRWLRAAGNELHVFDARSRRQTVLSRDFSVVRTSPYSGHALGDVLVVDDTLTILNAIIPTPEKAGFLLHAFDRDGSIQRSFGDDSAGYRLDMEFPARRLLSPAVAGGFWSAHRTRYVVERWTVEGTQIETLTRNASWFRPYMGPMREMASGMPRPFIQAVREDSRGRLWVLVSVPDSRWERGARGSREGPRVIDYNQTFDTIIEAIDLRTGTILVSERVDPHLVQFVDDAEVASYEETAEGVPKIVLWRMGISDARSPGNL